MVIISPRAGIMVIISPRADYETFRADYRNHSTKSARPLSIVKFEFQGDNGVYKGQRFFYTSSVPNFSSILDKNCPIIVP